MSIYICLVLVALVAVAQNKVSFKTEELKEVANKLKLDSLDTLGVGYSFVARDKHQLVIRKNGDDMIEHIGIKLFPMGYRQQVYVDVLDFLESGLLCNVFHLTRNQLKYMDAKFIRGSWNQMLTLSASASCSLNKINEKAYQAIWKEGNAEKINLLIPIKYDFLMNAPRKELEANFIRDLKAYRIKQKSVDCAVDVARLTVVKDGSDTLYMLPGKHYNLESITNTTFFKLKDSVEYVPVIDPKYPVQTIANTLLLDCDRVPEAKISLTVIGSDKKNSTILVPVRNLIAFAKSQGCVPYFGYEETKDGQLQGGLFLYNKELGYDHVLSLSCDVKDIATDKLVFTSRAYLYTPTTNVKNLYNDIKSKKKLK